MRLLLVFSSTVLCALANVAQSQDTIATTRPPDSAGVTGLQRLRARTTEVGRKSLFVARRTERLVFSSDAAVAQWSRHDDPVSQTFRMLSPVAFWVPIATVTAVPLVWADEAEDGHQLNASYGRNAAAALALGLVVSRTTKHFIHRARPCTGAEPDDISIRPISDSATLCPTGSGVNSYSSFFSEHTMALFAIASAASFQAQRQSAPNATTVTIATFAAASVFSIGRIYQRHHWLTDVLAGAAVGTATGFAAAQLSPASRHR